MSMNPNTPVLDISIGGDQRVNLYLALIVPYLAAILALGLRLWSRRLSGAKYGWDDLLIVLSFIVATGEAILFSYGLHLGLGKPMGPSSEQRLKESILVVFFTELLYAATMFLTRSSALVLWTRLFHQKKTRWYCWVWQAVNIMWYLALLVVTCLQCRPLWVFWTPLTTEHIYSEVCTISLPTFFTAASSIGIIIDVAIISLPLVLCWRLNLNHSAKILVCGMFATGFLETAISGVRLHAALVLNLNDPVEALNTTWTYSLVGAWSLAEMYIGIVSACLPCLRPVIAKLVPRSLVPKSLQKRIIAPFSTKSRFKRGGNGVNQIGTNGDVPISDLSLLKTTLIDNDFAGAGKSCSDRRDPTSDVESGIVEIAPSVLGSTSWLNQTQRIDINIEVESRSHGDVSPRHAVVIVEKSVQINSEKNSLDARRE